jgi:hypothetical protein
MAPIAGWFIRVEDNYYGNRHGAMFTGLSNATMVFNKFRNKGRTPELVPVVTISLQEYNDLKLAALPKLDAPAYAPGVLSGKPFATSWCFLPDCTICHTGAYAIKVEGPIE